ncbi:hypothetical protein GGQ85_004134 [Nitrobacter vulgaris]|nr:hypothetical protein [Nitrobacter vulgaris]
MRSAGTLAHAARKWRPTLDVKSASLVGYSRAISPVRIGERSGGEPKLENILENPPEFRARSKAHGSIFRHEGEPLYFSEK